MTSETSKTDGQDFEKLAEGFERRAVESRKKGRVHLFLIFLLLAGTIMGWYLTNYIATKDVEASRKVARELITARPIGFEDIASCGETTIAVGRRGVIRISTDHGRTWEDSSNATRRTLNAIEFDKDCMVAIAAGDTGVVLVSTDGGSTWDAPETYTRNDFYDVALSADGRTAIAAGDKGLLRFSDDGGKTWENPGNVTGQDVNGVALNGDGDTAVAVGENNLIKVFTREEQDSKEKWKEGEDWTDDSGKERDDFEAVALSSDGKSAVVVGDDGAILFSADVTAEDGGWDRKTGKKARSNFNDVAFSRKTAVAVGRRGVIWASTDGGKNWNFFDSKQGNTLEAVALSGDGKIAVAVGRDGTVLVSEDHGRSWKLRTTVAPSRLRAVAFGAKDNVAMIVGGNTTVLRSESSDGQILPKMEIIPVEGDTRETRTPPADEARDGQSSQRTFENLFALFQSDFLRVGITVLFMFMAQHLFGLARYEFRLAAFYDARRDAILLTPADAFPRSRDIDELDQFMQALSPDALEIGRPSKIIVDRMMQMMNGLIAGGRYRHGKRSGKQDAGGGRPDD